MRLFSRFVRLQNSRIFCERERRTIARKRLFCSLTIRVLGAILIFLRLFARSFVFGAEASISARAEVRHVIATKFQLS